MKLKIILLILTLNFVKAQTYQKDWSALKSKIEASTPISINEAEGFLAKYSIQLSQFPDNTTELYSLIANNYYAESKFEKA